ncbi:glycosyltransferase [Marininema halotolerans]|uniref:Glycosyltransferase, GT2 family n=1 Tax=Marininema halotolerans TaxID=1155944 RepID=A0A1I6RPF8_9BACL|nr:glycosyltransferase [Marininema halotolerans]SFS66623.1 Glycosyltransferase, GT2 family [Marininema halotolerans]
MTITSIIIPVQNQLSYTKQCIESIRAYTKEGTYELIVIDNGSEDVTMQWLQAQQDLILIRNHENKGFPKACNQGIHAAKGERILFLNNDTVVTSRWLEQLVCSLESAPNIGAVGPVTNHASYGTAISVPYNDIKGLPAFADQYNRSDPTRWEERAKLIGYCLLTRREVLKEVGEFDERFTPGNFEDDDWCFRARLLGYRLILCQDTFIHHHGSVSFGREEQRFAELLEKNRQVFEQKWGVDPSILFHVKTESLDWLNLTGKGEQRVLDLRCGSGATLLTIKHHLPSVSCFGVEPHRDAAKAATHVGNVMNQEVDAPIPWPKEYFDTILLGDSLGHVENPAEWLQRMKHHLKRGGIMAATLPNLCHYGVLSQLLQGLWVEGPRHRFTLQSLHTLFQSQGLEKVMIRGLTLPQSSEEEEQWIDRLATLTSPAMKEQYLCFQYQVRAVREEAAYVRHLKFLIRRIENHLDEEASLQEVLRQVTSQGISIQEVIAIIHMDMIDKVEMLHRIAQGCYEQGMMDEAISLMENAESLAPDHSDTLYNLALLWQQRHQPTKALAYLERIKKMDESTQQLMARVRKAVTDESL